MRKLTEIQKRNTTSHIINLSLFLGLNKSKYKKMATFFINFENIITQYAHMYILLVYVVVLLVIAF
jgi:hypothetical protein